MTVIFKGVKVIHTHIACGCNKEVKQSYMLGAYVWLRKESKCILVRSCFTHEIAREKQTDSHIPTCKTYSKIIVWSDYFMTFKRISAKCKWGVRIISNSDLLAVYCISLWFNNHIAYFILLLYASIVTVA